MSEVQVLDQNKIDTWKKFAKQIRSNNHDLLRGLVHYPDAVLVGGCQRSGTTMISSVIMQAEGMAKLSELNSALVLAGVVQPKADTTYCFQTTYINECYHEYWRYETHNKVVWMIRNPYSVVYSLTRFSERFCLDELFMSCGRHMMNETDRVKFDRFGLFAINRIRRACYAYNAKVIQLQSLLENLGTDRVFVVDYDELVGNKQDVLSAVFSFLGVPYRDEYALCINDNSLKKADNLSEKNIALIQALCGSYYSQAKNLVTAF